ncbi:amino acid ABC transporter permease [Cryobacterium sp. PH31-L1]|uniref:amino acid ABC transporter permease n=1 Tax=Cryobacterium sp. PH31-L1 TaxID=3046199 RepID=UPI0024BB3560|nr:amino acid ABC transporter permease [Cryobacterium sp. PH31-L1]MDJ0378464.1 amino acid ABC transporter permease [Cryobacterium sp. PH31-L1]
MEFLNALITSWPTLIKGLTVTLSLTALTLVFSVILGAIIVALKMSKIRALSAFATAYLAIVRGVPLIALLFVIYFGIVSVVKVDAFTAAAIGLSVHSSAYVAEIFRSGINSVHNGQIEASRSLGMSRIATMSKVVAPQALRVVVPALVNQAIISLKDSAVASFITVDELFMSAQRLSAATFQPLTYYAIVSLYYLAIVGAMTYFSGRVERYFEKRG